MQPKLGFLPLRPKSPPPKPLLRAAPLPRLRVEIADTGSGISREDQQRIFERFYRVENAVHTEVGTGLGLSIVRGILDKHGSQVHMTSALGIGTVFWFDLPLEDSDADELELLAGRRRYELEANALEA